MSADLNSLLLRYGQFWQEAMIVRVPAEAECWLFEREADAFRAFRADIPWWRRIFVERNLPRNIRELSNANSLNYEIYSSVLRRFLSDTALAAYNAMLSQRVPVYVLREWTGDTLIGEVMIRALQDRWHDLNPDESVKLPLTFGAVYPSLMRKYLLTAFDENIATTQIGLLGGDLRAASILDQFEENFAATEQSEGSTPSSEENDVTMGLFVGDLWGKSALAESGENIAATQQSHEQTKPSEESDSTTSMVSGDLAGAASFGIVSSKEQSEATKITLDRFTHDGHLIEIELDLVGNTFRVAPHCAGFGFAATVACFMENPNRWTLEQAARSGAIRKLAGEVRRDVTTGRFTVQ
jgi:hypothetical protein